MKRKTKYRIVTDKYAGYEVQRWRWWFPFWLQVGVNTHLTVEAARQYIKKSQKKVVEYYKEDTD